MVFSRPCTIRLAGPHEDLGPAAAVMMQLRTHLTRDAFIEQARRQMREGGYRLAVLEEGGIVRAVAGFRIWEMLHSGNHMYVDDLVTDADSRSSGLGGRLLNWLKEVARKEGCRHLELDSGVQRDAAHRFYFRQGMTISSYHFRMPLD